MPRAAFHMIRGIGHSPNWEAPAEVLQTMLPFLLATAPGSP
jgi:pimeloyl-ACP methyl ester carboxylesterase